MERLRGEEGRQRKQRRDLKRGKGKVEMRNESGGEIKR